MIVEVKNRSGQTVRLTLSGKSGESLLKDLKTQVRREELDSVRVVEAPKGEDKGDKTKGKKG